jgi:GTPase SAR1 family protein
VLLLGPRQVGKSTLLGELKPDLVLKLRTLAARARPVTRTGSSTRAIAAICPPTTGRMASSTKPRLTDSRSMRYR